MKGVARFVRNNAVAMLALFLVLGGTTYAASTALIGKNTVASPQVVNGSLQTKDLSKKARKALKGNRGPRGLQGPAGQTGARGATGVTGAAGAPGAAGTAVAWAYVSSSGTVDPTQSKGITDANVTHPATGNYCFSGLSFTPKNIIVSANNIGPVYDTLPAGSIPTTGQTFVTCAGAQARVTTWGVTAAALADRNFYVWFE